MTEIKIPFFVTKVERYTGSDKPANMEALELETSPIFLNEFYEEIDFSSTITKIRLSFQDGAEKEVYNDLLDEKSILKNFELSWEKEKVNFWTSGEEIDETKIEINYLEMGGNNNVLEIYFKPQFAGVVKITSTSQIKPNGSNDDGKKLTDNSGNDKQKDTRQKITSLQNQINKLEEKLRKQPNNSDSNSEDKEKLAR